MEHEPNGADGLPRTPSPGAAAEAEVAARLAAERRAVVERLERSGVDMAGLVAAARDSNADDEHDPEGQTIAYERAQLAASADAARAALAELDAAAERLAAGTYGVCEVCGRPIAPARLEARPTARTCVEHAGRRRRGAG